MHGRVVGAVVVTAPNNNRVGLDDLLSAVVELDERTRGLPAITRSELLAFVGGVFRSVVSRGVQLGIAAIVLREWRP